MPGGKGRTQHVTKAQKGQKICHKLFLGFYGHLNCTKCAVAPTAGICGQKAWICSLLINDKEMAGTLLDFKACINMLLDKTNECEISLERGIIIN